MAAKSLPLSLLIRAHGCGREVLAKNEHISCACLINGIHVCVRLTVSGLTTLALSLETQVNAYMVR